MTLATGGLLLVLRWMGLGLPRDARTWIVLASIGTLNGAVPFVLIGWGQQSVPSSTTGILIATSPFVTLLLAHFMTSDESFGWSKLAGMALGFTGVLVLFGGLASGGASGDATGAAARGVANAATGAATGAAAGQVLSAEPWHMAAICAAAACYAASGVLIRRLAHLPNLVVVTGTVLCASVLLWLPLLLVGSPIGSHAQGGIEWQSMVAIVFLALGPTGIAYVLRIRLVQRNGAVYMSGAGYLIPVFAVLWGWVFLGEQPGLRTLVALGLILTGIAVSQSRSYTQASATKER